MVELLIRINGTQIRFGQTALENILLLFLWTIQLNWIYNHILLWNIVGLIGLTICRIYLIDFHYVRTHLCLVLIHIGLFIFYLVSSIEAIIKLSKELSVNF